MRTFLALVLAFAVSGLAQAQDFYTMPNYYTHMEACVKVKTNNITLPDDLDEDEKSLVFMIACQCEYDHLPTEGEIVTESIYNQSLEACQAKMEKVGLEVFLKIYGERLLESNPE